ncbi:MAG: ATP-binding protein [Oscillospiraceae bacterium]|nr:ATP-binding protein [Oscillospiraceae bacterium]
MLTVKKIFKKTKIRNGTLFAKLLFTVLSFAVMTLLSYIFLRSTIHDQIRTNTNAILDFQQEKVERNIEEHKLPVEIYSNMIRDIIISGGNADDVREFIDRESYYLQNSNVHKDCFGGLFGYFETLPGGAILISSEELDIPSNFNPLNHSWYTEAVAFKNNIAQTVPYPGLFNNESAVIYSHAIFNEKNELLGVFCMRTKREALGKDIIETTLAQGGNGVLFSENYICLAHYNPEYTGLHISEIPSDMVLFEEDLKSGNEIHEQEMTNYKGEQCLIFFRTLSNGWHFCVLIPKASYYQSLTSATFFLIAIGTILASVLCLVIVRIEIARTKSETESKQKSAFLSIMSHEIRTPINAIVGMTEIGKTAKEPTRKDYCFTRIEDASRYLQGVISDILDMSKIEANKLELSEIDFDFKQELTKITELIRFSADDKRQTFSVAIDENIPPVLIGDSQRISQVITNLLSNAVKFTPDKGKINLSAKNISQSDNKCKIQVTVKDNGIGISPEQQGKLFQSFHQAESSTTRRFGGTGLGLAISKGIVEAMKGEIHIESELGEGASFIFTVELNISECKELDSAAEQKPDINGIFKDRQILLAEDVEINREIVGALLETTLVKIDNAETGLQALNLFSENPDKYNLIFMDINMPEMDGYEATKKIRALNIPEAKTIPIIAMTANVFKEDIDKCLEAGMDGHVGKPLNMDDVLDKMRVFML